MGDDNEHNVLTSGLFAQLNPCSYFMQDSLGFHLESLNLKHAIQEKYRIAETAVTFQPQIKVSKEFYISSMY